MAFERNPWIHAGDEVKLYNLNFDNILSLRDYPGYNFKRVDTSVIEALGDYPIPTQQGGTVKKGERFHLHFNSVVIYRGGILPDRMYHPIFHPKPTF